MKQNVDGSIAHAVDNYSIECDDDRDTPLNAKWDTKLSDT